MRSFTINGAYVYINKKKAKWDWKVKLVTTNTVEQELVFINDAARIMDVNAEDGNYFVWELPGKITGTCTGREPLTININCNGKLEKFVFEVPRDLYQCPWDNCEDEPMLIKWNNDLLIMMSGTSDYKRWRSSRSVLYKIEYS